MKYLQDQPYVERGEEPKDSADGDSQDQEIPDYIHLVRYGFMKVTDSSNAQD